MMIVLLQKTKILFSFIYTFFPSYIKQPLGLFNTILNSPKCSSRDTGILLFVSWPNDFAFIYEVSVVTWVNHIKCKTCGRFFLTEKIPMKMQSFDQHLLLN